MSISECSGPMRSKDLTFSSFIIINILLVFPSIQALPSNVFYCCFAAVTSLLLSSESLSSSTGISGNGARQYVKELNWSGAMSPDGGRPSVLNGGNI